MSPDANETNVARPTEAPIPYGVIWRRLAEGKVVPFLGAGASLVGRPPKGVWSPKDSQFLPNGAELAKVLADEVRFPSSEKHEVEDLARVASYYMELNPEHRDGLLARLRACLGHAYESGRLHALLASLPGLEPLPGPRLFVVTNYDMMLEQAFKAAGKPYDLVVYPTATDRPELAAAVLWWKHGEENPIPTAPDQLRIDLTTTTVIFKMHGTLPAAAPPEGDTCVITEEDYAEFLARMTQSQAIPTIFHKYFHTRSFLFLGYSLRDWNLRVLLHNLRLPLAGAEDRPDTPARRPARPPDSWAIQYMPSPLEREVWRSRGVRIFHEDLDRFAEELERERDH